MHFLGRRSGCRSRLRDSIAGPARGARPVGTAVIGKQGAAGDCRAAVIGVRLRERRARGGLALLREAEGQGSVVARQQRQGDVVVRVALLVERVVILSRTDLPMTR